MFQIPQVHCHPLVLLLSCLKLNNNKEKLFYSVICTLYINVGIISRYIWLSMEHTAVHVIAQEVFFTHLSFLSQV